MTEALWSYIQKRIELEKECSDLKSEICQFYNTPKENWTLEEIVAGMDEVHELECHYKDSLVCITNVKHWLRLNGVGEDLYNVYSKMDLNTITCLQKIADLAIDCCANHNIQVNIVLDSPNKLRIEVETEAKSCNI